MEQLYSLHILDNLIFLQYRRQRAQRIYLPNLIHHYYPLEFFVTMDV